MAPTNQQGEPEVPEDAMEMLTTGHLHCGNISSLMANKWFLDGFVDCNGGS
jgi:hypothetical protein